jgi:tRNA A37 threonylcarbamoyladenosine biosynthesis protein TsaE
MLKPPVHHIDLYRMTQVTESMLVELEYYEIVEKVQTQSGFLFVEWPELCVDPKILKLTAEIKIEIEQKWVFQQSLQRQKIHRYLISINY